MSEAPEAYRNGVRAGCDSAYSDGWEEAIYWMDM